MPLDILHVALIFVLYRGNLRNYAKIIPISLLHFNLLDYFA